MHSSSNHPISRHPWLRKFSRRTLYVVGTLVVVLAAARLALPYALQTAINRRLARVPAYEGEVQSVHVALWRGAYVLRGVRIAKRGVAGEPFFIAREIDCSLAWRELFHRKVVSDLRVEGARLNFVQAGSPESSQLEADRRWQEVIADIFPIDITHFEIAEGAVHYRNDATKPKVDVFAEHIEALAQGLRNRPGQAGEEFPANLMLRAVTLGGGRLTVTGEAEPLAAQPHFELRVILDQVNLPELNEFLRAYGKVDVSAGAFKLYLEMAARDGRFEGYAKPFFSGIEFKDLGDEGKSLGEKVWEKVVSGLVKLFKNKPTDALATRIPFAGEFGKTEVGLWATFTSMVRHGFVEALTPRLEFSVKSAEIPLAPAPVKPPTTVPAQLPPENSVRRK